MTVRSAIETIVSRLGEENRPHVLEAAARITDAQLEALAARKDVDDLRSLRAHVGSLRQGRRPPTPASQRFFQRWVVGHITHVVRGETLVKAWKLGCGHTVPTQRRVLPTTQTTAVPCPKCGSGTRTPYERRRAQESFDAAFDRVYGRPEQRGRFVQAMKGSILLSSLSPLDKRARVVRAQVTEALRGLGLVAVGNEQEDVA